MLTMAARTQTVGRRERRSWQGKKKEKERDGRGCIRVERGEEEEGREHDRDAEDRGWQI
jgi:hypothetical protein